jgi:uncharacterized protein YozE (UPF0346 family)
MIYINLGFPKTSSTNLQKNFYPNIQNINYIGRYYHKPNSKIFDELNSYIEKRENFDQKRLIDLKENFKQICRNKINIISQENWTVPYEKNNVTKNIKIVSQFEKLDRVNKFFNDLNLDYKYFLIVRDKVTATKSLFVTESEYIDKLFGSECLDFNYFVSKFLNKDSDYEKMKLFFEVYNLKKIKQIISGRDLTLFEYDKIKNNPKEFIKDFSSYLGIKLDENLAKNISIKYRVTEKEHGSYISHQPKKSFKIIKKLIPDFLKKKIISLKIYKTLKMLFFNKIKVELSGGDEKLRKILYEIEKEN